MLLIPHTTIVASRAEADASGRGRGRGAIDPRTIDEGHADADADAVGPVARAVRSMATTPGAFKFRSQFWAAGSSESEPEPEPEPEPESAGCPPTRNRIVLQGDGWGRPALELTVDELTLDDVEKDPSGNWTLAQYSGLMLWDAATIFARWMHRYAAQVFAGRSVLELGAGSTGLPGLTAHMLGARHVVLTDHLPELVQSLDANIRRCQESRQINGAHVSAGTIRATMVRGHE